MNPDTPDIQLFHCFEEVYDPCLLKSSENVLIFTDVNFPYPAYPTIARRAVQKFGATGYILMAGEAQNLQDKTIHAAWMHADIILGMSFLPGNYSWMYTDLHNDALKAGGLLETAKRDGRAGNQTSIKNTIESE